MTDVRDFTLPSRQNEENKDILVSILRANTFILKQINTLNNKVERLEKRLEETQPCQISNADHKNGHLDEIDLRVFNRIETESHDQCAPVNNDNSKPHLKEVVQSYKDNFSVNGLTKIVTGHLIESVLWFCLLLSCLIFVGRESYYFYEEYQRHDIRTKVRITTVDDMALPVMTICEMEPKEMTVCWNNMSIDAISTNSLCTKTKPLIDFTEKEGKKHMDIIQHPTYPACVIINSKASKTILRSKEHNQMSIESNKTLYLYVHSKDDIAFPLRRGLHKPTATLDYNSDDIYLHFQNKRIFNRLPHPYPSNCTDDQENLVGGKYTVTVNKCKDTCVIKEQIETCNATLDHWKQSASKNLRLKATNGCAGKTVKNNNCAKKTRDCLSKLLKWSDDCNCPTRCSEEFVETVITTNKKELSYSYQQKLSKQSKTNKHTQAFKIFFSADSTLTNITEIPAYPANKFITDIGGWLGLFSGMSVLSVAEIIIFLVLSATAFIKRKTRAIEPEHAS